MIAALALLAVTACADDEAQVRARLQYVESELQDHEFATQAHYYGYGVGYMAVLTYLGVRINSTSRDKAKQSFAVGIVGSSLGLALGALRLPALVVAEEQLAAMPSSTEAEARAKLDHAEMLYASASMNVDKAKSWFQHVLAGVWSLGAMAFTYFVIDDIGGVIQQLIGGIVLGQGRPFLYPSGIRDSYKRYQALKASNRCIEDLMREPEEAAAAISVEVAGNGLVLRF